MVGYTTTYEIMNLMVKSGKGGDENLKKKNICVA
jgi:hypothetical protein